MRKSISKKTIWIFILIIFTIILIQFAYKILNSGNNIIKSDENDIFNISSYEAIVEVTVYSNKNTNKYILKQEYSNPNIFKQEVIEPENINGLTTIYDGTNLVLENSSLSLTKIYENYKFMQGSLLSLSSFIDEYKSQKEVQKEENETETIIKIKTNKNKYEAYKKLYINKETLLPTKMEILDINQNITVYILYTEIEINEISKEEILEN